jgi:hypothetical protein
MKIEGGDTENIQKKFRLRVYPLPGGANIGVLDNKRPGWVLIKARTSADIKPTPTFKF